MSVALLIALMGSHIALCQKYRSDLLVLRQSRVVFLCRVRKPAHIHVIGHIGKLDLTCYRVLYSPMCCINTRFAIEFRQRANGLDNVFVKTLE